MTKKLNNKTLLYIFIALLALFFIVKWYQKTRAEKTLNTELVSIDTSKVSEILLYPTAENRKEIKFFKENNVWKVKKDNVVAECEESTVKNLLQTLQELKAKSLVSTDKEKWKDYNVTDTTATRVKVKEKNKVVADLMIGRFSYQPAAQSYGMYGGGVTGSTFVRKYNDKEVYAVEGFIVFTFNQSFNSFRKQTIARFETAEVEKITFKYPADSSFTVELKDKKWKIGDILADSTKVANYISRMSFKSSSNFNDVFKPTSMATYTVSIEGKNLKPITIDAYQFNNDTLVINSSQNPKSWFNFDRKSLLNDIYISKTNLIPHTENHKSKKKK